MAWPALPSICEGHQGGLISKNLPWGRSKARAGTQGWKAIPPSCNSSSQNDPKRVKSVNASMREAKGVNGERTLKLSSFSFSLKVF